MKVRFLADADLSKAIVSVLSREPSLDFLTAQAAGLRGMTDREVLTLAAEQQRVLVRTMSEQCRRTSARSRTLENIAPVYFSSRRASTWGQQ